MALGGVVCITTILVLLVGRRRKRPPSISVPEALHVLLHGPAGKRAMAARALSSIIFGEVTVLEDLLDDIDGKHPEFGVPRTDGRTLRDVLVADLSPAVRELIELATRNDDQWPDDDEWNVLAKTAREKLPRVVVETCNVQVPDVLPFNTRVCCAECGATASTKFLCPITRNVTYCTAAHEKLDEDRHRFWCGL